MTSSEPRGAISTDPENDVIRTKGSHLDRPSVSLELTLYTSKEPGLNCVCLYYYYKSVPKPPNQREKVHICDFCITEERIRMVNYPRANEKYLLENGTLLTDDSTCHDSETLEKMKDWFPKLNSTKYLDFAIGSVEDGLRLVLRLLFRRFYFCNIHIPHLVIMRPFVNKCLETMMEEFKSSFSRCGGLDMENEFDGLTRLYTALGSAVTIQVVSTNIEDLLPIQNFRSNLYIYFQAEQAKNSLLYFFSLSSNGSPVMFPLITSSSPVNPHFPSQIANSFVLFAPSRYTLSRILMRVITPQWRFS